GHTLSAVEGTILHRLLELAVVRFGPSVFAEEFVSNHGFLLELLCHDHGVCGASRTELLAKLQQHLAIMKDRASLQEYLFSDCYKRDCEREVFWLTNGHVKKGIIDLYLEDDHQVHIID